MTKHYDPTEHTIVVAAIPILKGFAEDEFIKVEFDSDAFTDKAGVDGDVYRAAIKDARATVTITLMQGADANAELAALHLLDRNAPNGAGVGPFLLKDRQGTTIYEAAESWIARGAEPTLGKETGTRQWKIRVAKMNSFEGSR